MRKASAQILGAFLLGFLMPMAVLYAVVRWNSRPVADAPDGTTFSAETNSVQAEFTIPVLSEDGSISSMPLEEYIVRVVLREMPADFETEALKAQAVVARTYALRRSTRSAKHPGGAVCTESSCCQGYRTPEDFLSSGGTQEDLEKITRAVEATGSQVLTYEGALIDATYFSCSGGMTEDAAAVWGADIPYLQSAASPGEETATHYTDTVTFTPEEFAEALQADLKGSPGKWFGKLVRTEGGGVESLVIDGVTYKGTTLRKLLNLRSTAFTITAMEQSIVITTKGYGHRVGMSQYGADAMAVSGSTYDQILAHYYQGTELCDYAL